MFTLEQQYLKAVLEIDATRFFNIVEQYGFPKTLLNNIPIDIYEYAFHRRGILEWNKKLKFPLHYVTACWHEILTFFILLEDKSIGETAYYLKEKNTKIREYFCSQQKIDMNDIPYSDLWMMFNTSYPEDGVEECVMDTEESLFAQGVNKKDIDLYCAVSKFQFNEVVRLLNAGADPTAMMGSEKETCIQMIEDKRDFYTMLVAPMIKQKKTDNDVCMDICDIVGLAACQKMYMCIVNKTM